MEDRIKPEYQGKCIGYLLRARRSDTPTSYLIITPDNLQETTNLFSDIMQSPNVAIIRAFRGIKDLQSDEKFMDMWLSSVAKSDRDAIEHLERLILQN